MFKIFFKKQRQIESLIYDYLDKLKMTERHFSEALNICLKDGICGDFDFLTKQTHKFESKADDIREEIKTLMYGIVKGISTVSGRTLLNILFAWLLTPAVAGFIATALYFTIHLQYVPNP